MVSFSLSKYLITPKESTLWLLFGISELPASLLFPFGALPSKVRVPSHSPWDTMMGGGPIPEVAPKGLMGGERVQLETLEGGRHHVWVGQNGTVSDFIMWLRMQQNLKLVNFF